ncbi:CDP-glycerol glycerophosphotransferase family protein [Exiguobacterium sp. SL14]|nr:CDP-glycerol glycerophosphotransferase family protein [Exiguobacterium sp. SL14]MCY1692562.1 CDP-glycerol glycerophosphotransferase family protein [Exiguobacterium sp. SL14]
MAPDRIYPLGVPRTDQLLNVARQARAREKLYARYPDWRSKRIILLAPTFRGNGQTTAHYDQELDFEKFRRELGYGYSPVATDAPVCSQSTSRTGRVCGSDH